MLDINKCTLNFFNYKSILLWYFQYYLISSYNNFEFLKTELFCNIYILAPLFDSFLTFTEWPGITVFVLIRALPWKLYYNNMAIHYIIILIWLKFCQDKWPTLRNSLFVRGLLVHEQTMLSKAPLNLDDKSGYTSNVWLCIYNT